MTSDIQSPPSTAFRTVGALRLLTWPALEASGADAAVTARSGGVSSGPYATLNLSLSVGDDPGCVLENRRRLAAAFGARLDDFVFARQVHGAGVRVVGEADRGSGAFSPATAPSPAADALVTASPGVVLAILTADCVPIVLHDPVAGVLACVHAGWRGTVAGVSAAASPPCKASAPARPTSSPASAPPSPRTATRSAPTSARPSPGRSAPLRRFIRPDPSAPGRWLLDLWAANRHALRDAGVPAAQIHTTPLPTGPAPPPRRPRHLLQ